MITQGWSIDTARVQVALERNSTSFFFSFLFNMYLIFKMLVKINQDLTVKNEVKNLRLIEVKKYLRPYVLMNNKILIFAINFLWLSLILFSIFI